MCVRFTNHSLSEIKCVAFTDLLIESVCFLQELEKVLDVFNITLARQQAQMEVNMRRTHTARLSRSSSITDLLPLKVYRSGQKVVGKKAVGGQKQAGGGFFSSFFGRKAKKEEQEPEESKEMESK